MYLLHMNDKNDIQIQQNRELFMLHCYFSNGHTMWGLATIGLVFLPFVLSVVIDHLCALKIEDIKNWKMINLSTICIAGLCQQRRVPAVENHNTMSLKDVPAWLMQTLGKLPHCLLHLALSIKDVPAWLMQTTGRLPQCLRHLPIIQTFNHLRVFLQLNEANLKLDDTKKKKKLTTNELEEIRGDFSLEQEVNA
jgi:hypothetical protein